MKNLFLLLLTFSSYSYAETRSEIWKGHFIPTQQGVSREEISVETVALSAPNNEQQTFIRFNGFQSSVADLGTHLQSKDWLTFTTFPEYFPKLMALGKISGYSISIRIKNGKLNGFIGVYFQDQHEEILGTFELTQRNESWVKAYKMQLNVPLFDDPKAFTQWNGNLVQYKDGLIAYGIHTKSLSQDGSNMFTLKNSSQGTWARDTFQLDFFSFLLKKDRTLKLRPSYILRGKTSHQSVFQVDLITRKDIKIKEPGNRVVGKVKIKLTER